MTRTLQHSPASRRMPELDALRGLMLIGMTLTHLPTAMSHYAYQPFGFVAWAEGFILISAVLTGRIYGRLLENNTAQTMTRRLWLRAGKLYSYHIGLLAVAFTIVAAMAVHSHQPALQGLVDFYLGQRALAIVSSLLLVYCPPLLDILPMYIGFLLFTPVVLYVGRRWGWKLLLPASACIWLAAQFGLREAVYNIAVRATGIEIPLKNLGAFNWYAWQVLWVAGLWIGAGAAARTAAVFKSRWMIAAAAASAVAFLAMRYQVPEYFALHPVDQGASWVLFDKWQLGILRLLNLAALAALFAGLRSAKQLAWPPLVLLGKASLEVFVVHVLVCFAAFAAVGEGLNAPISYQVAVLVTSFSILYTVAYAKRWHKRRQAGAYAMWPQARAAE